MRSDKETKQWFKDVASKDPGMYYAVAILEKEGFVRKHCSCGTWFWTVNENQETCDDPACSGGFRMFTDNPSSKKLSYVQVWNEFSSMFRKKGYVIVPRYPVVARWNPTMEFTIASIAAFQPHVVNGEADPPAEKLVLPQFCLRFGDIDNVGITGSHMTGFIMIGQHMFVPPDTWDQNRAFEDLYDWFIQGLGLPKSELTMHEDAWAGGGNYGPCMEFFSRGVELANQVYMLYEQTPSGDKELSLKVLDMGMGMERNAWFSQGKGTIYDATFPLVLERMKDRIQISPDYELFAKFLPKAAYLNIDEIDNVQDAWERVAREMGIQAGELRESIEPLQALYSIAEHARSLLFALTDGSLPSNTGGGYNLRTIFRRAQGFIEKFSWDVEIAEVAQWHAEELQDMFPELLENIDETKRILEMEAEKYVENMKRSRSVLESELKKWDIEKSALFEWDVSDPAQSFVIQKMIDLYDQHGIEPLRVARAIKDVGGPIVAVPENFYKLVSEKHEQQEQKTATKKGRHFPVDDCERTQILYFDNYSRTEFTATVQKVIDGKHIVLDRTAFYPTSGGQEHDTGYLLAGGEECRVVDVIKQGPIIIHLTQGTQMKPGQEVVGKIDWPRRKQLAQHHTATHIINGAARSILGNHVWQAGAAKTTEKARIDITHYDTLTESELQAIEDKANDIIAQAIPLHNELQQKGEAEQKHGFRLYQGGAVPGQTIRVVDIPGFDTEACGGTHLNNTSEAVRIKILKSSKVQDGIVRIEYVAGERAEQFMREREEIVAKLAELLGVQKQYVPAAAEELFRKWKKARKGKLDQYEQPALEPYEGEDVIEKTASLLKTQPEHIVKTIERFQKDIAKGQDV